MKFILYGGVAPQAGIDLEANTYDQKITDIKIYNNLIHSDNYAFISSKGTIKAEIKENELYGKINISEAIEKIEIENNIIRRRTYQRRTR